MLVHKKNVQYIYIKLHVQVEYKDRGYGLFQWPKSTVNLKVKVYFISLLTPIFLKASAAAASKLLQSCPTLCDAIDGSPPGSPVPGILQARTLEWVAISFSNSWKWKVKVKSLSRPTLCDPMDCSLPGSSAHGIFQARVLEWVPTPVFLPAESHGQRSLVGYSPWGHNESDKSEQLTQRFI